MRCPARNTTKQPLSDRLPDDNGPGISAEDRNDVFKAFHKLDHSKNQDGNGAGLGLTIARDILRGHGGDVILSDSPLGGLSTVLRFPI